MNGFWDRAEKDPAAGEIRDGDTRYLLFRVDVIAAMLAGLDDAARAQALAAFATAVRDNGGQSLQRYLDMVDGDIDALFATVCRTAGDLGWGAWTLDRSVDAIVLDVQNSPFATTRVSAEEPNCTPILGMFQALAETVFGASAEVAETRCAAHAGDGSGCTFYAQRRAPRAPPKLTATQATTGAPG